MPPTAEGASLVTIQPHILMLVLTGMCLVLYQLSKYLQTIT